MDKKIKILPFSSDIKTLSINIYFLILGYIGLFIYQWFLKSGCDTRFIDMMLPMFTVFCMGIIILIIPLFSNLVNPMANELILSLPLGGIGYVLIRVVRIILIYILLTFTIYSIIYFTTNKKNFLGHFVDIKLICSSFIFLAGFGLLVMLIGRNPIYAYTSTIFLFVFSYFFRGSGLMYWHVCQWIQPKPNFSAIWKLEYTMFISGVICFILSSIFIKNKNYLLKS
ncbi:MAG: hypothetical protein ABF289_11440 [Clostridiales bacterium]